MRALTPFLFSALLAACGGSSTEPVEPTSNSTPEAAAEPPAASPASAEEQTTRGGELYGQHCAGCHGNAGQGSAKAPPVVGSEALPLAGRPGAKRNVEFHTALDVFTWVKANMPPTAPGSLSDEEYVAIMAFALKANGVSLDAPLDGAKAAEIRLH